MSQIQALSQRMRDYWAARDARERLLLLLCGVLLLITVLYLAWLPLAREQERLQRRLPQLQQQVQRMQDLVQQWQAASPQTAGQDWRAMSQARLVAFRLPASQARLLANDSQSQRWQFDDVPFDAFLDWLTSLYQDAGVRVRSINLAPAAPGLARITVELHRP